jgi:hypothetical protein
MCAILLAATFSATALPYEGRPPTVIISHDPGGSMSAYIKKYMGMRDAHQKLKIDGDCESSCALFFGYVPLEDVCVTSKARLGFHNASRPEGTGIMMAKLPDTIIMWVLDEGLTDDMKYLDQKVLNATIQTCPDAP